jgi:ribosomal protein L37AE/L43A
MLELYLIIYLAGVLAFTYLTLRHHGLWIKSPATQLEEKKALAEQVMKTLHSALCPICGAHTHVESLDLWRSNAAILRCEKCGQKSMWKLEGYTWLLVAPYRYKPKP